MNKYSLAILVMSILILPSCGSFDGKNGTRVSYFEGTKKIQCTAEYKGGKKNGSYQEFYKNGNMRYKTWFENDTIKDSTFFYHENGRIASIQIFNKGRKSGCWKKFSKEGTLYNIMCFENDHLNGPVTSYTYRTGKLLELLNYKNGLKDGKQEYYYNNGEPKSVAYYTEDKPCLGLQEWHESGKRINNDFKISIEEQNKVLLQNKMIYIVRLENPRADDRVCEISDSDTGLVITPYIYFTPSDNFFVREYYVFKGGYIMKKVKIAAFRKTNMGNTMIKTTTINVAANNY